MSFNSRDDFKIPSLLPRGSADSGQRMSSPSGLLPVRWQSSNLKLGLTTPKLMLFSFCHSVDW